VSDFYLIAEIDQPAGYNGFVRIIPVSDFPDQFLKLKKVYLDFWGDKKKFIIEEVSSKKKQLLA
jgi:ribosomal 30S subunit maturation factor RimM